MKTPAKPQPKKMSRKERTETIIEMAKEQHEDEGTLEIDDGAKLSEGDDNGTYVAAWVWVSFAGTKLCKGEGSANGGKTDGDHSDCESGCPVADAEDAAA